MTDRDRRGAAYHEAGHVIVAWALGLQIGTIAIGLDGDDAAGKTDIDADQAHLSTLDRLAISLAGLEAQELFQCPTNDHGGFGDLAMANEIIGDDVPEEQQLQMLDAGYQRAREWITLHEAKLVQLATRLVDRGAIDGHEVSDLLKV